MNGYSYWITLALIVHSSVATGSFEFHENIWMSDKIPYHEIVYPEDMTSASGLIYSPDYPARFTTTTNHSVKLVHMSFKCLLELEFVWRHERRMESEDVPEILIGNFSGVPVPITIPITRRIFDLECWTLTMNSTVSSAPFYIRYSITRLYEFKRTTADFRPGVTLTRLENNENSLDMSDRQKMTGALISSFSYDINQYDKISTALEPDGNSSLVKTYDGWTKFFLDLKKLRCTDTVINIQILQLNFVPCNSMKKEENNRCGRFNKSCKNRSHGSYLGVTSVSQHADYNETMYRRCYNCGTRSDLRDGWLNYNLSFLSDRPEKFPRFYYKVMNPLANTGVLLKYKVYGCPWDGREFADVKRSGLTKHMNITCNNGTKLFNVCEDESLPKNDLPICNEDGTWRCDPRCIPDDDERWLKEVNKSPLESGDSHILVTVIIAPITVVLLILLIALALIVYKQRKAVTPLKMSKIGKKKSPQNDREISDVMIEVDDLTSDASYVNVAMETNQQKTSVEIHRTFEEEKSADNNNSKKEKEKQSITVCITRK